MDEQLAHEKTLTGLMPFLAGVDFVYGMGMMDMGMTVGFEQFLMDAEFVRMFKRTERPVLVDAVEVIEAVGPAGNFLSQKHTLKHMRDEISTTDLIERRMREAWENDGALTMPQRANAKARKILSEHFHSPLSPEIIRELDCIIERERKLLL